MWHVIYVTILTSTTAELFSALAINFPSVVNFFILLNDTRSDISTSNENISLKKIQRHFQLCILYIICSIYGLEIDIALKTGIIHWRKLTSISRFFYLLSKKSILVEICISKPEVHLLHNICKHLFNFRPFLFFTSFFFSMLSSIAFSLFPLSVSIFCPIPKIQSQRLHSQHLFFKKNFFIEV